VNFYRHIVAVKKLMKEGLTFEVAAEEVVSEVKARTGADWALVDGADLDAAMKDVATVNEVVNFLTRGGKTLVVQEVELLTTLMAYGKMNLETASVWINTFENKFSADVKYQAMEVFSFWARHHVSLDEAFDLTVDLIKDNSIRKDMAPRVPVQFIKPVMSFMADNKTTFSDAVGNVEGIISNLPAFWRYNSGNAVDMTVAIDPVKAIAMRMQAGLTREAATVEVSKFFMYGFLKEAAPGVLENTALLMSKVGLNEEQSVALVKGLMRQVPANTPADVKAATVSGVINMTIAQSIFPKISFYRMLRNFEKADNAQQALLVEKLESFGMPQEKAAALATSMLADIYNSYGEQFKVDFADIFIANLSKSGDAQGAFWLSRSFMAKILSPFSSQKRARIQPGEVAAEFSKSPQDNAQGIADALKRVNALESAFILSGPKGISDELVDVASALMAVYKIEFREAVGMTRVFATQLARMLQSEEFKGYRDGDRQVLLQKMLGSLAVYLRHGYDGLVTDQRFDADALNRLRILAEESLAKFNPKIAEAVAVFNARGVAFSDAYGQIARITDVGSTDDNDVNRILAVTYLMDGLSSYEELNIPDGRGLWSIFTRDLGKLYPEKVKTGFVQEMKAASTFMKSGMAPGEAFALVVKLLSYHVPFVASMAELIIAQAEEDFYASLKFGQVRAYLKQNFGFQATGLAKGVVKLVKARVNDAPLVDQAEVAAATENDMIASAITIAMAHKYLRDEITWMQKYMVVGAVEKMQEAGDLAGLKAMHQEYVGAAWVGSNKDNAATGGIDLGQGNYLKVIATDAAGMQQFDPAQLQQFQKDLRGIVPVPVGVPQSVNMQVLLGV
ncbi:MAG: hypothetical protein HQL17_02200, partial [Candidatus Omnitrophica bacterium]|nr:hypothetical protein [Candidatus Omnitrophota bacterium]